MATNSDSEDLDEPLVTFLHPKPPDMTDAEWADHKQRTTTRIQTFFDILAAGRDPTHFLRTGNPFPTHKPKGCVIHTKRMNKESAPSNQRARARDDHGSSVRSTAQGRKKLIKERKRPARVKPRPKRTRNEQTKRDSVMSRFCKLKRKSRQHHRRRPTTGDQSKRISVSYGDNASGNGNSHNITIGDGAQNGGSHDESINFTSMLDDLDYDEEDEEDDDSDDEGWGEEEGFDYGEDEDDNDDGRGGPPPILSA